ncbi:hypothetical protein EKL97_14890 [Flavobacterium sp. LS1P28]|uniref:hypothetical protein n=1 Tax=unclassified Flavobacterium TaxID=196869 RepID=UPI000F82DDC7|nr:MULTISPECIES: hypothetical protein [unclassified Flavobacterium]RTY77719.1 hypothetical protein EKL97_14890 [Flavobacterium sp. LS1P28]RTY85525.1 hypothetical protein EKM00_14290 [Flavobacterium sp. RSP15]
MNNKFVEKFNKLNLVLNNHFLLNNSTEIRYSKVYRKSKLKYIVNKSPYWILLFENDLIGFRKKEVIEDYATFYFLKLKDKSIHIIGILHKYSDDNVRTEKLIFNKKISFLLYYLLISKFNKAWKP